MRDAAERRAEGIGEESRQVNLEMTRQESKQPESLGAIPPFFISELWR
jgi:hypothetical protein